MNETPSSGEPIISDAETLPLVDQQPAPEAKGNYIVQAWLVILLALAYGAALAGVQTTLGPKIAQNKENETLLVVPQIVPGADETASVSLTITGADGKEYRIYKACAANGDPIGWVVPTGGQGFADRIELLIGLDLPATSITGMYVLDQKETPGLGNFITSADFQKQFIGKSTQKSIAVIKEDPASGSNEIRALSGATISSESVAGIVNRTIANLKTTLTALAKDPTAVDKKAAGHQE